MTAEYSKVATQVKSLELLLEQVKQTLAAAQKREPSSFMRFKGTLKGWLDADDDLLTECRFNFKDPCKAS